MENQSKVKKLRDTVRLTFRSNLILRLITKAKLIKQSQWRKLIIQILSWVTSDTSERVKMNDSNKNFINTKITRWNINPEETYLSLSSRALFFSVSEIWRKNISHPELNLRILVEKKYYFSPPAAGNEGLASAARLEHHSLSTIWRHSSAAKKECLRTCTLIHLKVLSDGNF